MSGAELPRGHIAMRLSASIEQLEQARCRARSKADYWIIKTAIDNMREALEELRFRSEQIDDLVAEIEDMERYRDQ